MEQRFTRVRSTKNIITFSIFVIAGILLAILPADIGANMAGYTLIVIGIIMASLLKSDHYNSHTKVRYQRAQLYFDSTQKSALLNAIVSDPKSIDNTLEGKGQTLRLDIYFNPKVNRAALQLFEYIPHEYCPCTEIYSYDIADIKQLIHK